MEGKFNIAIVSDYINVIHYAEEINLIRQVAKNIDFIFFGFRETDKEAKKIIEKLGSVQYFKPVSIIHFYKLVKTNSINLLFIPVINNTYNVTSENYKKYIDFSIMGIPTLAPDMYPYNQIIKNEVNGFLYDTEKKENLPAFIYDIFLKTVKDKKINISQMDFLVERVEADIYNKYYLADNYINNFTNEIYNINNK